MVSLFGPGFDSPQLHYNSKIKPLILNGLAAFFMLIFHFLTITLPLA